MRRLALKKGQAWRPGVTRRSACPFFIIYKGLRVRIDRYDRAVRVVVQLRIFDAAQMVDAAGERGVSSEFMSIMYFSSLEALHTYAHGPLHTKAMQWWRATEQKHAHIGIMHELYYSPKNCWEGIYVNYHPTGLGATSIEVPSVEKDGKSSWYSPLVQGKGPLRYSKGRMGRTFGEKQEWPEFEKLSAGE